MTNEEIAKRLEEGAERVWNYGGYQEYVRLSVAQDIVERIRDEMQATIRQRAFQIAEQDAKIYAYESIIANSNFKAVLPKTKEGEK